MTRKIVLDYIITLIFGRCIMTWINQVELVKLKRIIMKKRIEAFWLRMRTAILNSPVEVFLSVSACIMGCYDFESGNRYFEMMLRYFPVLFLLAYTLNQLSEGGRKRLLYYFSVLLWAPFFMLSDKDHSFPTYMVSLVVVQLVYLISGWPRDNKRFFEKGLLYLISLFSACLLSGVAWGLSISIFECIRYIFEIWQGGETRFVTYASFVAFCAILPLLFLMFNQRQEDKVVGNRLFDLLLNYVLSPALIIYAVILYLYFIKITVLWSLPKGAVANIVISFTTAIFVLKGCQVFLSRRYFDWLYKHASIAVFPALAMFWVGTYYRIHEYGFTEPRVYLVVVGLILTLTAVLFLMKRWAHYLYAACLAIFLLVSVTYIPGIRAKDIERISQTARGNYPMRDGQDIVEEFLLIYSDEEIDIRGYNSLEKLWDDESRGGAWLSAIDDTIFVYDKRKELIYQKSCDEFLEDQLEKVGLSLSDSIPDSAYPDLLRIDLDSSTVILEGLNLRKDSIYHIFYIKGLCYLKQ